MENTVRDTLHTALRKTAGAASRIDIERILHPRSLAVFGASDSKAKFGGRIIHHLVRHGFAGDIYPINLHRPEIVGRKAYPSIAAVPSAPDVAILAVPVNTLVQNLNEAAAAGVGCCVIISTGFAEAGDEGSTRQSELVEIAARTGMRIVGPNCMGIIEPHHHMTLCSSVVLETDKLRDGSIGLISQSGALMVSIFDRANDDGIGFRHCVSLGNQVDLEICDFIEYMAGDAQTSAVCTYIEGLLDGQRFRRAAAACRAAGKPLFVVKTGRTEAGVRSARSHTASLAGSFESFAAICREEGVVLAQDPDDMVRAAHLLSLHRGCRAGGVAVLSTSGGGAGIASDRVTEIGLELATLTPETRVRLGDILLPPQADNPVDLGGRKLPESTEIAGLATEILFGDARVGYGLGVLTSMPFFAVRSKLIGETALASGKPCILVLTPGAAANASRQILRDLGQFHVDRFEDALRVLSLIDTHLRLKEAALPAPLRPAGLPASVPGSPAAGALTESEAKRLLAAYGVAVAREAHADTADDAARRAQEIGFPVVLKAVSRDIAHKSDVGAVSVGLASAEAVRKAAADMLARLATNAPGARIEGFSIQEMVRGEAEVIIGANNDPQFGPIVMVGLGGIAVEILHDVALAPAPLCMSRARAMIERLRSAPLLQGARGRPPLDIDAVADALVRLSWLAADLGPQLVDLEVNPLIVRKRGDGAVAVDGRGSIAAK